MKLTAVPVQSAAWPGTHTAPGMVLPAPATGLAPASDGSAGRTSGMATLPYSAWARVRKVSGSYSPRGLDSALVKWGLRLVLL